MNKVYVFFISILFIFNCFCSEIFAKISVVIPCHHKHFQYIPTLLLTISEQTLIPDEVVISVSEAYRVDQTLFDQIEGCCFPFKLKILKTDKVKYAGDNRNIACSHATGDILITQDADDLPHPQRIEILACILTHTNAVHVIHRWYPADLTAFPVKFDWIEHYESFDTIPLIPIYSIVELNAKYSYIHNGNIAIKRKVFKKVRWTSMKQKQDVIFNQHVIRKFRKTVFITAPLVIYRPHLSSHKENEKKSLARDSSFRRKCNEDIVRVFSLISSIDKSDGISRVNFKHFRNNIIQG